MIFILSPVFLLILDKIFLKEKMSKRQIISILVILACVGAAVYLGS
jgi:drug/metabolite transporter (DMT)-like permease